MTKIIIREKLEKVFGDMMINMGLDLQNPSLEKTPYRIAKMYVDELCYGLFTEKPRMAIQDAVSDDMIVIRDIVVNSLCEHHFLPFIGNCTIAYIPNKKILGLSKFNRLVSWWASRPTLQEMLTYNIANDIKEILDTDHVGVFMSAQHMCVKLRGIKDPCSDTVVNSLHGFFRSDWNVRAEFLSICKK